MHTMTVAEQGKKQYFWVNKVKPQHIIVSTTSTSISSFMWQENNNPYGASSSHNPYYSQSPPSASTNTPLQFYAAGSDQAQFYPGSRSSLEGNVGAQGSISQQGVQPGFGGNIAQP